MKIRPFELALVIIFGALIISAVVALKFYSPDPDPGESLIGASVSVWGTLPAEAMNSVIEDISRTDEGFKKVKYRFIPTEEFDRVFLNALADQNPPDLILMSHEGLVKHRNRLEPTSYELFPERDFKDKYIDGANIMALSDGIYGWPVAVDPLVQYWNRNIFSTAGILSAPKTWEEVVGSIVPSLTKRDNNRNIGQSSLAMGEYRNVENAFSVISMLLLQGGSVMVGERGKNYQIGLDDTATKEKAGVFFNAVTFFTNFSTVSNSLYTWNRSLTLDRDLFLQEKLAIYFGLGTEARDLALKNPNLSFDIAEVPQGAAATVKRTYGSFYGFFVPKVAKNKAGAGIVRLKLTSDENAKKLADRYNLAPVSRNLLSQGSNDIYGRVIYASAPYARGWLNPDKSEAEEAFARMFEDVNANRSDVERAINDATSRIRQAY
jgi:multiple sugar transport system substrate-binding protein